MFVVERDQFDQWSYNYTDGKKTNRFSKQPVISWHRRLHCGYIITSMYYNFIHVSYRSGLLTQLNM